MSFAGVAGVVVAVSILAHAYLPALHARHRDLQGQHWYHAFTWWDGWWYVGIARHGYRFFSADRQSPVAFFPGYPLLMRLISFRISGPVVAGVTLSIISGLGAAVLFHRWCVRTVGPAQARVALLLLVLYPSPFT